MYNVLNMFIVWNVYYVININIIISFVKESGVV